MSRGQLTQTLKITTKLDNGNITTHDIKISDGAPLIPNGQVDTFDDLPKDAYRNTMMFVVNESSLYIYTYENITDEIMKWIKLGDLNIEVDTFKSWLKYQDEPENLTIKDYEDSIRGNGIKNITLSVTDI